MGFGGKREGEDRGVGELAYLIAELNQVMLNPDGAINPNVEICLCGRVGTCKSQENEGFGKALSFLLRGVLWLNALLLVFYYVCKGGYETIGRGSGLLCMVVVILTGLGLF